MRAEPDGMMDNVAPAPPPPPPPPPLAPQGVPTAAADDLQEAATPRSRLRRLQWVKIPAGRVAGGGRNVWTDLDNRFGSSGSPSKLDFAQMEELFRVAEPSVSTSSVIRRQQTASLSEDVDRHRNRDEVKKERIAVNGFPSHSYGTSPVGPDHRYLFIALDRGCAS